MSKVKMYMKVPGSSLLQPVCYLPIRGTHTGNDHSSQHSSHVERTGIRMPAVSGHGSKSRIPDPLPAHWSR